MPLSTEENYNFELVGNPENKNPFLSYVSAIDKTIAAAGVLIRGSQNVFKKISGTIAARCGLKRRGIADATLAPVRSGYEWNTSLGAIRVLRVVNGTLQVESAIADGVTLVWYTILAGLTDLQSRFVFDPWWDADNQKDTLLMVNGGTDIKSWDGGIAIALSGADFTGAITGISIDNGGSLYLPGDTISVAGGVGAILKVTTTDMSGAITGISIENPGQGFSIGTNRATTPISSPSGGSNATVNITSVGNAGSIAIAGTSNWASQGFPLDGGQVTVNGTDYTYTSGADGTTLYGVTPATTSTIPPNSVALSTVKSNGTDFGDTFTNDMIKVIGNRAHVGSYQSREVHISNDGNFKDFDVPTPRLSGSAELLTLDDTVTGISVSKGNAFISAGTKYWYQIIYSPLTVNNIATEVTQVTPLPTADGDAALAHEFIDTVGDNIVYLSFDQQLRELGTFRNLNDLVIPSLSLDVATEFSEQQFIDGPAVGHLRASGEFIHLTVPVTGVLWMYQARKQPNSAGDIVAERIWHAPQIIGIARMAIIAGVQYAHSNANPQIYQIFDTGQYHDDAPDNSPLAYTCVLALAYRNYGRRQGRWQCSKWYFEGYATQGTQIFANHIVEYQGSGTIQPMTVNTAQKLAHFYSSSNNPSLGDSSLGDNSLGIGIVTAQDAQDLLPKFRCIRTVNPVNFFEHAIVIYSQDLDAQWEMICVGANTATVGSQQAGFLAT